jgi:hypothetical protein
MRTLPAVTVAALLGLGCAEVDPVGGVLDIVDPAVVTVMAYDTDVVSQGTGFFIDGEGTLITNLHVVRGASFALGMQDGQTLFVLGDILAYDEDADLIALRARTHPLVFQDPRQSPDPVYVDYQQQRFGIPTGSMGPEDEFEKNPSWLRLAQRGAGRGDRLFVVGSPLGLEHSVSEGIVSGVRELVPFGNVMQISAAISPGSSGSPVVNDNGEVVGVATATRIDGQSVNFAVPVDRLRQFVDSIDPKGINFGGTGPGRGLLGWRMAEQDEARQRMDYARGQGNYAACERIGTEFLDVYRGDFQITELLIQCMGDRAGGLPDLVGYEVLRTAVPLAEAVVDRNPNDYSAWALLRHSAWVVSTEDAWDVVEQAQRTMPGSRESYRLRADMLKAENFRTPRWDEVVAALENALEAPTANSRPRTLRSPRAEIEGLSTIRYELGVAYAETGDLEGVIRQLVALREMLAVAHPSQHEGIAQDMSILLERTRDLR